MSGIPQFHVIFSAKGSLTFPVQVVVGRKSRGKWVKVGQCGVLVIRKVQCHWFPAKVMGEYPTTGWFFIG